jgi:hypothetical protein
MDANIAEAQVIANNVILIIQYITEFAQQMLEKK